jgi:3-deoxy-D-manno-octulosonate 8-phosphate phosphatase KdsC-like HAD superfamily phosphatase
MSTVKINYTETTDRPIKSVTWTHDYEDCEATIDEDGDIRVFGSVATYVKAADALEWARAVLAMVEQAQGGE